LSHALSYLLISHDLALVSRFADRILVMANGKIVEQGSAAHVVANPGHGATQALCAATRAAQDHLTALGVEL
jgi:ABC-type microcin C transport system duplicated ATPase subunit YejF